MLFMTGLNLRLETTADQLQLILYGLRALLLEHDSVDNEPARIRLVAIGPLSLDLEIVAYVKTTDWNQFLSVREELFLQIMREVEESGTALSPPAKIQYNESAKPVSTRDKEASGS